MKFNKDTVKSFFNFFFVTLGVVFFVLILFVTYFYFADPLGFRFGANSGEVVSEDSILSVNQQETLRALGVDPNSIPSEFTQEQQECFVGKFGEERVNEIVGGASPTPTELFKAKDCL